MAVRVRDKNNIPQIANRVKEINRLKARVGYVKGPYYVGGKITTKGIARVHEYGVSIPVTDKMRAFFRWKFGINLKASTTHIRIPERSFIRSGARLSEPKLMRMTKSRIRDVLAGNISPRQFYNALGDEMRDTMQQYARALMDPPNAELTIRNKGFDDPLVETGHMIRSMEVVVE